MKAELTWLHKITDGDGGIVLRPITELPPRAVVVGVVFGPSDEYQRHASVQLTIRGVDMLFVRMELEVARASFADCRRAGLTLPQPRTFADFVLDIGGRGVKRWGKPVRATVIVAQMTAAAAMREVD